MSVVFNELLLCCHKKKTMTSIYHFLVANGVINHKELQNYQGRRNIFPIQGLTSDLWEGRGEGEGGAEKTLLLVSLNFFRKIGEIKPSPPKALQLCHP